MVYVTLGVNPVIILLAAVEEAVEKFTHVLPLLVVYCQISQVVFADAFIVTE